ncbi:hypothetical protein NLJ89_g6912 [Agrocybe chaxingu]|uniref:Uncharacterized protein n=1 Tax=Agrocybe chaxingu TaxID=84603 RepID=A0A9W8JXD3_9AGAR|nr:hypothetical protein NLJ89_g6912 [Agrocybe chaxingu]
MRWSAPPERREIALVLLSLIAYFFAYNLDASLNLIGVDPQATQGALFRNIGLGKTRVIGPDGRKPPGWRDPLEMDIYGEWQWEEGHVAGEGKERSQPTVSGRHGATWRAQQEMMNTSPGDQSFSESTVDNALQRWGEDVPQTQVVKHVPGYSILDNVVLLNRTFYLVTDNKHAFPSIPTIVSSQGTGYAEWKVISLREGREVLGTYGSTIRGVSWMSADSQPDNSTLFALWRTYSSLDTSIDETGRTKLAPPHRLIFPHSHVFTDTGVDPDHYWEKRRRADTGFHPYLAKAAFPQLTAQYLEGMEDYQKMSVPYVFERLVVADRAAARKVGKEGMPAFSSAFELGGSSHWWEPVRRSLAQFLDEYEVEPKAKKSVTYLYSQTVPSAPKLESADHNALVEALQKMGKSHGYEVHIVSIDTSQTNWVDRMTAIVKSSVVLGVHGSHLMDSVFMRPGPFSTLMEFFPEDKFARDMQLAAHSIGLRYQGWQGKRPLTNDPSAVAPPKNEPVSIDVSAVVQAVGEALSRDAK